MSLCLVSTKPPENSPQNPTHPVCLISPRPFLLSCLWDVFSFPLEALDQLFFSSRIRSNCLECDGNNHALGSSKREAEEKSCGFAAPAGGAPMNSRRTGKYYLALLSRLKCLGGSRAPRAVAPNVIQDAETLVFCVFASIDEALRGWSGNTLTSSLGTVVHKVETERAR